MRISKGLITLLAGALLILPDGCSKPDSIRLSDQSYFPLRVGSYQIYQVKETNYQHRSCSDADPPPLVYELKVLTYDSVKNVYGGYTYLIHRYMRADSKQPWVPLDTWSARVTANQAMVTEGNTSFVKLYFPLVNNSTWDGNLFNSNGREDYKLKDLGHPFQMENGDQYPTTLTVVQIDYEDLIVHFDKCLEVYAASIGLVYKESTHLVFLQEPCSDQQKVHVGQIFVQKLISSGRE